MGNKNPLKKETWSLATNWSITLSQKGKDIGIKLNSRKKHPTRKNMLHSLLKRYLNRWCVISNAIGVNVQVYTTSNILMSIHIVSIGIDIIIFATTTLIV